ncbi:MAG: DUF1737 domain-containing protein [Bacteroidota bacterium]
MKVSFNGQVALAFLFIGILLTTWLVSYAQSPIESTPQYRLLSEEFFPGQRLEKTASFEAQVNEYLQEGWKCLGPPSFQSGSPGQLQPAIITQALVKE